MNHGVQFWTDARESELRRLWRQGLSGGEIARALGHGVSRSGVNAKAIRLGLSRKGDATIALNRQKAALEREAGKRAESVRLALERRAQQAQALVAQATDAPSMQPVPFIEARLGQCHYPLWGANERTGLVCGAETGGARFCAFHAQRCFIPVRR